jgi:hypothetical protein
MRATQQSWGRSGWSVLCQGQGMRATQQSWGRSGWSVLCCTWTGFVTQHWQVLPARHNQNQEVFMIWQRPTAYNSHVGLQGGTVFG